MSTVTSTTSYVVRLSDVRLRYDWLRQDVFSSATSRRLYLGLKLTVTAGRVDKSIQRAVCRWLVQSHHVRTTIEVNIFCSKWRCETRLRWRTRWDKTALYGSILTSTQRHVTARACGPLAAVNNARPQVDSWERCGDITLLVAYELRVSH